MSVIPPETSERYAGTLKSRPKPYLSLNFITTLMGHYFS